jgi:hypothetical protein
MGYYPFFFPKKPEGWLYNDRGDHLIKRSICTARRTFPAKSQGPIFGQEIVRNSISLARK